MAVVYNSDEYRRQLQQVPAGASGYLSYQKTENKGLMNGVSDTTKNQLKTLQQGYKQSDTVKEAQDTWKNLQGQKPAGYESKYGEALDELLAKIQNPDKFQYEFNGDNLFKAYQDLYTNKGKQASIDVQGQAAANTGGYGNSYGETVGAQAYQGQLMNLYDKGMEMYDRALQAYNAEQEKNMQTYQVLNQADTTDYGRYRDLVGDWQTEEEQAYNRMTQQEQMDYEKYQNQLNYYTGLAQIENQAWSTEEQRQEAIREFTLNYNETMREFESTMKYNYDKMASDEAIAAGHDAATMYSADRSAEASMYATDKTAEYHEKSLKLQEKDQKLEREKFEEDKKRYLKEEARALAKAKTEEQQKAQDQILQILTSDKLDKVPSSLIKKSGWTKEEVEALGIKAEKITYTPTAKVETRTIRQGADGKWYVDKPDGTREEVTPKDTDIIGSKYTWVDETRFAMLGMKK